MFRLTLKTILILSLKNTEQIEIQKCPKRTIKELTDNYTCFSDYVTNKTRYELLPGRA